MEEIDNSTNTLDFNMQLLFTDIASSAPPKKSKNTDLNNEANKLIRTDTENTPPTNAKDTVPCISKTLRTGSSLKSQKILKSWHHANPMLS